MNIFKRMGNRYRAVKTCLNKLDIEKSQRFFVFWDIIYCRLFLHCNYDEYGQYHFYKYRNSYRKNFILLRHKKLLYRKINPRRYTMHKKVFYKKIQRGIHREVLYMPECGLDAFLAFVKKHQRVIVKPDVGSRGVGIQLFKFENDNQAQAFFESFTDEMLCEEYIYQHKEMNALNPNSVNSLRIVALCDEGKVEILAACVKSGGSADAIVDNMHNYGIGADVDIETGIVTTFGHDYHNHVYSHHPVTGKQIIGFVIPYWKETLDLVKATHLDMAECPFVGWDVAITEKGPEIIEANSAPGHKLMQYFNEQPKGQYLRAYIKRHK